MVKVEERPKEGDGVLCDDSKGKALAIYAPIIFFPSRNTPSSNEIISKTFKIYYCGFILSCETK